VSATLYSPGRFLVLISVEGWLDLGAIVWLEGLGKLKKSSNLIGNSSRDLPACSIMLTLTTLPPGPVIGYLLLLLIFLFLLN
jgi:hypothetical protein